MKMLGKSISTLLALPIIVLVGGFIFATIYSNWFTYVHYFRITLEVETPDGIKTASSVLKAVYVESPKWVLQNTSLSSALHGEAVFLDLGGGKNVVAMLAYAGDGVPWLGPDLAARALGRDKTSKSRDRRWYQDAPYWTGSAELTGELKLAFATFSDAEDPTSARVVHADKFESVFGPGVRLKRLWIEMSQESVTNKVANDLPWVGDYAQETSAWRAMVAHEKLGPSGSAMPDQFFRR